MKIIEKIKKLKINVKLLIMQSIIIFSALLMLIIFSTFFISIMLKREAVVNLQNTNKQALSMIEAYDHSLTDSAVKLGSVFASYNNQNSMAISQQEIDRFTEVSGAVATVFIRKGDDFQRIQTSLRKEDGTRAIGTLLDHNHPAYPLLLEGKTYAGKAVLFGRYYMTHYNPIKKGNKIEGVLFIGLDFTEGFDGLKKRIKEIKIGDTGYTYVLDDREGKNRGTLICHPAQEGNNIYDSKDSNGKDFVKEILEKRDGVIEYSWINKELGETSSREKIAAYNQYKKWDWVIVSGTYIDELMKTANMLRNFMVIAFAVLCGLLLAILYFVIMKLVIHPVDSLSGIISKISEGVFEDTSATDEIIISGTQDEIANLKKILFSFRIKIRDIMHKIQRIIDELASSSLEMTSTSESFSTNAQTQSATVEQITASIEEISGGMENIAAGASNQFASIVTLLDKMKEFTQTIHTMEENINRALKVTSSISEDAKAGAESIRVMSSNMNNILQSSGDMTNIVKIISDISGQINLLSLNAAIEAARAGDQGRGFAVVADEISKLADKTASSIKEIDLLINKNTGEINSGMSSVESSIVTISRIIDGIGVTSEMINLVSGSMKRQVEVNAEVNIEADNVKSRSTEIKNSTDEQKNAVDEIVKSVGYINELTQSNASGSEEMAANSETNAAIAETLKHEIEFFKL